MVEKWVTYPIFEKTCHEPAAQFLTEADDPVLGPGVDLKVEALGSSEVIDEEMALSLSLSLQAGCELRVTNERIRCSDMITADVLDNGLGILEQFLLHIRVAGGRTYPTQLIVDIQ